MPAIRELYELQTIDLDLDQRSKRLAEIEAALAGPTPFAEMQQNAARLERQFDDLASQQATLDDEIKSLSERIQAAESKLYSGSVSNPRELTSLQADITQMRRQQSEHEERLLAVMDELKAVRSLLDDAKGQLERAEEEWESQHVAMSQESKVLKGEVKELTGKRTEQAKAIPPGELSTYEHVRRTHKGKAVARLRNGMCESCRIALPTRQANAVRTAAQPVKCPSCGLILLAS